MTRPATRAPADPQTGRRCDECGDGRYAPKACSGCGKALCPRCGSLLEWGECEECGGEGETYPGLLHDLDPLWYDPEDTEPCHICGGAGGWWYCPNSREWCEAHPLAVATSEEG